MQCMHAMHTESGRTIYKHWPLRPAELSRHRMQCMHAKHTESSRTRYKHWPSRPAELSRHRMQCMHAMHTESGRTRYKHWPCLLSSWRGKCFRFRVSDTFCVLSNDQKL